MSIEDTKKMMAQLGVVSLVEGAQPLGVKPVDPEAKRKALTGFTQAAEEDRRTKLRETRRHNRSPEVKEARSKVDALLSAAFVKPESVRAKLLKEADRKGTDATLRNFVCDPASFGKRQLSFGKPAVLPKASHLKDALTNLVKVELVAPRTRSIAGRRIKQ